MTLQHFTPPEQAPEYIPPRDPTGGRLVAWAQSLQAAAQLGAALSATAFVPQHFRGKPEETSAAILCGDELGLSPIQALRSIYVVSGTPALYARAMVALVLAHGHEVWTDEDTQHTVTVSGRRRGSSHTETVTWTQDRARKAGYTNNKKYTSDPQAMLYARASGDVARRVAADVLAGVAHNVEELELAEDGPAPKVKRKAPDAEPKRTAKRAAVPPREPEEPELDELAAWNATPPKTDTAPPDDRTESGDAQEGLPLEPEEGKHRPDGVELIRPAQLRMLHASFRSAGIEDKGSRHAYASGVIERDIAGSEELTKEEASRVIDALATAEESGAEEGQ